MVFLTSPMRFILAVALSLLSTAVFAQDPDLLATLDYGTFQGAYSSTYNISYWQKIPFAQPPLGPLRFRGPQPPAPIPNGTVYNSTEPFDMCVQRTVNGSEDCLYLGLYSRPWTAGQQPLRPVVVTFYGGAYIQGSASFASLPPSAFPILNVSDASELVFVYPNYRTNAFGFLPGREVGADRNGSDLNPGLLDQDAAIKCEWTVRVHVFPKRGCFLTWGDDRSRGDWKKKTIQPTATARSLARSLTDSHLSQGPKSTFPTLAAIHPRYPFGASPPAAALSCPKSLPTQAATTTTRPRLSHRFLHARWRAVPFGPRPMTTTHPRHRPFTTTFRRWWAVARDRTVWRASRRPTCRRCEMRRW